MKKFLMFLCAVTLVFGMVGSASALSFTDTKDLDVYLGGPGQPDSGTYSWDHATPTDFPLAYGYVHSVTIELAASYVDHYNTVDVQGIIHGNNPDGALMIPSDVV